MYFNRFDICEAYYCYAALYHGGQFSKEYRIFGRLNRIDFVPGSKPDDPDELNENARVIFDNLVRAKYH